MTWPNRDLWLMALVTTPFVTGFAMVGLLVPLLAFELGASPALVGLLVGSKAFVPMVLAIPVGTLIDRVGAHRPMFIALAMAALGVVSVALFPSLPVLFANQVVFGTSQLVFIVASQRLVSAMSTGSARDRDFGWYTTFQSAGQMVGPVVAGLVLDLSGFGAAFLVTAVLAALASLGAVVLRRASAPASTGPRIDDLVEASTEAHPAPPETQGPPTQPAKEEATERDLRDPTGSTGTIAGIRQLLRNPGFLMAVAVSYAVLLSQSVRQAFLPLYLESLAIPATLIGVIISSRGFISMLVRPSLPTFVRWLGGRSGTLIVMVACLVVGIALNSLFTTFPGFLFAAAIVGLGAGLTQPLSMSTVADHVEPRRLGFALGVRLTANRLAQVLGPMVIGLVAELAGVRWIFLVSAALLATVIPLMLAWRPTFDRSERALREAERREG